MTAAPPLAVRPTDLTERLSAIVGPKGLTRDPADMEPWLTDWRGRFHGRAMAMVMPATVEEVAGVLKLASETRTPIVPQGGNSGMVGGATPDGSGRSLLLSLRRMDALRSVDTESRLAIVEAGLVLQMLHEKVAGYGLRFPLTLGGKGSATVGGLISTNAGGTQVLRHGTMRALVEGIEAVFPNGLIYRGLASLKKDNRGYDLKHLLIGAEGTLGIVTAATLRLVPALVDRTVIWAGLDSPQAARRLLLFMEDAAGDAMEGFEIIPKSCVANVVAHIPGTRPPLEGDHPWQVLIELVADDPDMEIPAKRAERLMAEAFDKDLIDDAVISANEAQAEAFWKIRDSISEAERAHGPAMQHDISVPVAAMADFITRASADVEARFEGSRAIAFGHMGDGNVHFHVTAPKGSDPVAWPVGQGKAISSHVYDLVVEAGGSISAEHGIGQLKSHELARLDDDARLHALAAIKAGLDPAGIMNPGKLIPLAPGGEAT